MTDFNPSTHVDLRHERLADCVFGMDCGTPRAGHALSFMQRRLAAATSSKWRDAIVDEVGGDGVIRLTTLDDGSSLAVWHHVDSRAAVQVGDPVALHAIYHVLAIGATWLSVAEVAS